MSSDPAIDPSQFEDDLRPITPDDPAGPDLRRKETFFDELNACRREDEEAGEKRWRVLKDGALKLLREKSKDLRIAAGVVEARSRLEGLPGLLGGLGLFRAIQSTFWETAHPRPEPEEGAAQYEVRESVIASLDGKMVLPLLVSRFPLLPDSVRLPGDAKRGYSLYTREAMSRLEQDIDALRRKSQSDPGDSEAIEAGEARLSSLRAAIESGIELTDRSFFVALRDRYQEALDFLEQFNGEILSDALYGSRGKIFYNTRLALERIKEWAEGVLLNDKPGDDEDDDGGADETPADEPEEVAADEPEPEPGPRPSRRKSSTGGGGGLGGPIVDAEDARARVRAAARFLRQSDPSDPVGYLLTRAIHLGDAFRSDAAPAPATEDRQSLRRLAAEGDWGGVSERAEGVIEGEAGRSWLDAHRLSIAALDESGHSEAAGAVRALLGGWLRTRPDWPLSELDDGTAAAGAETRSWLASEFAPPSPPARSPEPAYLPPPEAASPPGDAPESPEARADALVADGRALEAVSVLARAARTAASGRGRFLSMLRQAEICIDLDRLEIAAPLLEELSRQVDQFRLEDWEDSIVVARIFASLCRCFRGRDDARAKAAYARLCRIDIHAALALGEI